MWDIIQHPEMGAHSWDNPWAFLDNRRAFPVFLAPRLLLVGCGGGAKAGNVDEELHIDRAEDRWKNPNAQLRGLADSLDFRGGHSREVRELPSRSSFVVPSSIQFHFTAACRSRRPLSPGGILSPCWASCYWKEFGSTTNKIIKNGLFIDVSLGAKCQPSIAEINQDQFLSTGCKESLGEPVQMETPTTKISDTRKINIIILVFALETSSYDSAQMTFGVTICQIKCRCLF